jgi:hypothetical protein
MNIKLRDRIKAHITEDPQRLRMSEWIVDEADDCGTAACIAGWAMLLSHHETPSYDRFVSAETLANNLDIPWDIAHRLCFVSRWLPRFLDEWCKADTSTEKAAVACRVLDSLNDLEEWQGMVWTPPCDVRPLARTSWLL